MTTVDHPLLTASAAATASLRAMRLLLVDDNPVNLELLEELLGQAGYTQLTLLQDAEQVHATCLAWEPDLVLLDLHMPARNGLEVLEDLRELTAGPTRLPVVVLTADPGLDARRRALAAGARDFVNKPFDAVELDLRVENQLTTRRLYLELQDHNRRLDDQVADRTRQLEQARLESLRVLASVAEYHDDDTHQHTHRVGALATLIAEQAGLADETVRHLRDAAPLHDIGKIAVADAVLRKPGPLDARERAEMMRHAVIGSQILGHASSPTLRLAEEVARTHHERWDGSGYPVGLGGLDIPVSGRIVAIADVMDALTHERPYKSAWSLEDTLDHIWREAGAHFDPELVAPLHAVDRARLREILGLAT